MREMKLPKLKLLTEAGLTVMSRSDAGSLHSKQKFFIFSSLWGQRDLFHCPRGRGETCLILCSTRFARLAGTVTSGVSAARRFAHDAPHT